MAIGLVMAAVAAVAAGADDAPTAPRADAAVGQDGPTQAVSASAPPTLADSVPNDYPGIHNVVAYAPDFYSGGVPEGDEGFDTLKAWGIRTILSVDGAAPLVDKATSRGMRYVHLPIGYNGFDETRKVELVRAVRDLPRPIYLHCHHGKHRSAGAAGTVAVSLGWMSNDDAVARMKVSGTSPSYPGLYACTREASVLEQAVIDAAAAEFPAVARTSGVVRNMVAVDEVVERLKLIEKAGWKAPSNHPDLVPAAEAGQLADLLRTLADDAEVKPKPDDFHRQLARNAAEAQALEDLLVAPQIDVVRLGEQFKVINASCKECHRAHRD